MNTTDFDYSPWRHGGWYVTNVRYPSGSVGCVSRNYADKKWRIVCDPRPGSFPGGPDDHTYPSRDAAARAEFEIIEARRRLEELRQALHDENISYGELAELEHLVPYIDPSDVELLEAAGVPEFPEAS